MATVLERLEVLIDSKLNAQGLEAAKIGVGNLTSKLGPADSMLSKLGITGEVTSGQLAGLAAGAGAAALAGIATLAAQGVTKFQDLAGEVLKFQQVSGTSADTASRFVAVMDDYQVSADQGAMAISRMDKTIAQTPEALTALGVSIERSSSGAVDMEQTFLNVVNAFNSTNDASQKAAIGAAAFGRNWQELANLLSQGSGNLREAFANVTDGQIISEEELRKSEEYRLALDHLGDAVRDLEMSLGRTLVPALTVVADKTAGAIEKADALASKLSMLKTPIRIVAAAATGGATELLAMGDAALDTGFKFESLGATAAAVANNVVDLRTAMEALLDAASRSEAAQSRLEHAQLKLADAQERVANGGKTNAEILDEQSSALGKTSDKARQVADAMRGVEDAQRRVGDATESVVDAQKALEESQRRTTDATNELRNAQMSLLTATNAQPREAGDAADAAAEAKRRQASAELDLADSQDKLAKAQQNASDAAASYGAQSPEAIKASRELRRAQIDYEQSQQDLEDAQRGVNEAVRDQIAVDVQLKSMSGQLEDAQKQVADATKGVEDAQKANQQAAKTLEQRNRDLEDALRGVEDANRRVTDAQNARDGAAPKHNATTKTTQELELELRDAQREVRDATKGVADSAGDQTEALGKVNDLINNETTPAAQAAAEKTNAIRGAIDDLTKTLDPNSDAYKFLKAYSDLLGTVNSYASTGTTSYTASGSSSANAAERGLTTEVVPIKINLDGQTIANVLAPILRNQTRSNG